MFWQRKRADHKGDIRTEFLLSEIKSLFDLVLKQVERISVLEYQVAKLQSGLLLPDRPVSMPEQEVLSKEEQSFLELIGTGGSNIYTDGNVQLDQD